MNSYQGTQTELDIPAIIGDTQVVHLAARAFEGASLERVIIPEGVHCIRDRTFGNCAQLREITIPPSVVNIVSTAFDGCPADMLIICKEDSAAHKFAVSKGYSFRLY